MGLRIPPKGPGMSRERYLVCPNFCPEAEAMRQAIDHHFGEPKRHQAHLHQVWNYWYVPDLYTYLRTEPEKVIPKPLVDAFHQRLQAWCAQYLGLTDVTRPWLSLYVAGCGQGLHNDSRNGRWAYVFSLTRWDQRQFQGGETLVMKDEVGRPDPRLAEAHAGSSFYDLVPSHFNQLVVFDDRVIHGVRPLQGTMDPREGRLVMHGHIREGGIFAQGALSREALVPVLQEMGQCLERCVTTYGPHYHGLLSLRLQVGPQGRVERIHILTDRILEVDRNCKPATEVSAAICEVFKHLSFPQANGPTYITVPVSLGMPLP